MIMTNNILKEKIKEVEYIHRDNKVTICIAKTIDNFYIVGTSFCLDENTFTESIGEQYSYDDVIRQLEPLEGYLINYL